MFGFTVLNPFLLFFTLLAAIPVLIHLFHRRRFKEVRWAAMDFLLKAQKKSKSLLKLRHLLLLLLRCLAVIFIVLAVSQPLIKAPSGLGLGGKSSTYSIIIIDNSYSMGEKIENRQLFDKAKEKAADILGMLKTGDSVSLVTAGWKAKAVISEPTYQLSAARKEIESLKIGNAGNDLGGALQLAAALIKKKNEISKEIYIISDCQASAFRSEENNIKNAFAELSGKAAIFLVKTGNFNPGNNAVTNVTFSRELVDMVMPVRIMAEVTNFSKKDSLDCIASLYIEDKLRDSKRLLVRSGKTEPVAFYQKFTESGINTGYIEISADPLMKDNRVYFCVNVKGAVPVLVVDGKPGKKKFEGEGGFLSFVFNPFGAEDIGKKSVISAVVKDFRALSADALSGVKVVVLSNISFLPEETVMPLDSFVRGGNGILVFAGDLTNPQYMNSRFYREKSGLLPCVIGEKILPKEDGGTFFIDKVNTEHPLLAKFKESEIKELKKARFACFYELKYDASDPSVTILASFNNGMPAIMTKKCGKGNTIIVATGANRRWSDLVIKPMFLPLVYESVYYLSSGTEERRNLKIGDKLSRTISFSEAQSARLLTPDKRPAVYRSSISPEGRVLDYDGTDEPGFYRLYLGDKSDAYSVNLDTKNESNTERVDKMFLLKIAPKEKFYFIEDGEDTRRLITQGRKGIGIWKELILLAVLLLALESYLAYKFGKRT